MLMMKKFICLVLICLMLFSLTACSTETYEDTNGPDDYTLQTITDENIIKMDIGGSGFGHKETEFMGITSEEYYSKNFNGVYRLFLTNYILPSDAIIRISYINVHSGNFKMVAVLNDEIYYEFPIGTFSEDFYFKDMKGTFAIYCAGESADFEMHYEML